MSGLTSESTSKELMSKRSSLKMLIFVLIVHVFIVNKPETLDIFVWGGHAFCNSITTTDSGSFGRFQRQYFFSSYTYAI